MKQILLLLIILPLLSFGQSYWRWDYGGEKELLEELSGFDFQYANYVNGNGFNPPVVYPIGWSYDGKFAYYEEYCNDMCGCCSSALIVRDLASNRTLVNQRTALSENYNSNRGNASIWSDSEFQELFGQVVKDYKIFPVDADRYFTSNVISWSDDWDDYEFEILVKQEGRSFEVFLVTSYKRADRVSYEVIYQDEIKEDFNGGIGSVDYAGYFLNEINQYATIVLMHKDGGVEGENDYTIELVGVELP